MSGAWNGHGPRNGEVSYAVFCVCAGQETLPTLMTAIDQVPRTFFAGEFRDYLTGEKRPQFSLAIKQARACLVLVDFDRDVEQALKTVERLQQIFLSRIRVVGVAAQLPPALLVRAVRAGCSDFLPRPPGLAELTDAIRRFQQTVIVNPAPYVAVGKVVAFFGAKGGVGTTTLAVHLAHQLVTVHGKKTLLIDHKHQLGHVALYLGLKDTQYHFDELLRNVDRLDTELLNGFAIRHESGLVVMASPEIAAVAYESQNDELERVMDFLRSEYDYILIDSSIAYQDTKLSIIGESDEIYLVSTPDVASLRDLARLVEHIGLDPTANEKLRLIVNRSTANDSLTGEQIQKAVRFPVSHTVPNNYGELLHAINQGVPIPPSRKSPFNSALSGIGRAIVLGGPAAEAPEEHKFAFWK